MAFLTRLLVAEPFETWQGMEAAAKERYWDGLALALAEDNRGAGAIYLFGYVAEMFIKTAYFRFTGVGVADNISHSLKAAHNHAAWGGGNLHNLQSWVDLLIHVRGLSSNPMSAVNAGVIRFHVLRIQSHWNESIRYKHLRAQSNELAEVFASVEWLLTNYSMLWS